MYHGHYSPGNIELSCVFFGDLWGCLSHEVGGLWVGSSSHSVLKLYGRRFCMIEGEFAYWGETRLFGFIVPIRSSKERIAGGLRDRAGPKSSGITPNDTLRLTSSGVPHRARFGRLRCSLTGLFGL